MLRDDLIAARGLVEAHWGKGDRETGRIPRDKFCAMTALGAKRDACRQALIDALPADRRDGPYPVVEYNDDPSTTHADVLALFDRAIQAATPEPENKS
jgi:hypothetical protein